MNERNIIIMPGDGIGKKVLPEAIRVLDAVGFKPNMQWRTTTPNLLSR